MSYDGARFDARLFGVVGMTSFRCEMEGRVGSDEILVTCCCGERFGRFLIQLGFLALFVLLVSGLITVQRWPKPPPLLYEEESEDLMREWDATL